MPAPSAAAPSASPAPPSFETALAELEAIVARMESGELSLEESLAAHKRGLELARHCQGILAQAQQQVRVLEDETLKALPGGDPDL
jgi:exodeoxyribonuclease VII small subunit